MNIITLKSSVNWCKHELHQLTPLVDNPNEEVYRFYTEYKPEILFHEITKLPIGISFHCGPILKVGEINPQIGKPLKEVCRGYDIEGNQTFMALVFEHDISSNKETGIVQ
jgi:hypothetical protein